MLKVQVLVHCSRAEDLKRYLRSRGVMQVTEPEVDGTATPPAPVDVRALAERLESVESCLEMLAPYETARPLMQRLTAGPIVATPGRVEEVERELPPGPTAERCARIQARIRAGTDDIARSGELVAALEPWTGFDAPLDGLSAGEWTCELWSLPSGSEETLGALAAEHPLTAVEIIGERGGRLRAAVLARGEDAARVQERLKEAGGAHNAFEGLSGTPDSVIASERDRWPALERDAEAARDEAREIARSADGLRLLADHYREAIALAAVEEHFLRTDSAVLVEGWVRALDRRWLERELRARFDGIETALRPPRGDEQPPISLDNGRAVRPFEFVTTLYGRPVYGEKDPTPLLAPFFLLFFALCLTDAGYGLTLAAISGIVLYRLKPSGGAGKLFRLLLIGGIATAVVGIVAGGVFGVSAESLPPPISRFVLIDPLKEPMKMLNISFLMGIVHILFGMGIRMAASLRAGLVADALLDELAWMIFLLALAPLGYAGILGGEVPGGIMTAAKYAALGMAAVILMTGGRRWGSPVRKFFGGLVKFYDVVGYFGDVLSYARLLALGLATSAIALAVNDIARMVAGLPWYTGYAAMAAVLVGGHLFNLAVNTLGAFVHSGRLQYLEFFSKFFTGGGREFRPFRSERRYSVLRDSD
ncbi:MAG: hypothetical protein PHQ19_03080 [Candidatus Krumholzibacteria bacterium]|nr:hypothetical protein [Candidatus Krumholzibacteria bacterium]